jgi:hypothetical protein
VDGKPEAAEEEEVSVEDAILKQVKGRKKRQRGKKQAAEQCEEPEELRRGGCGSRTKLAAACRKVSRRATVARRRRDAFENERTQDGCQRRLAAARRGTSHRAEVARQMKADKKMPRHATVARCMRDIFRPNTTRRAKVARRKENSVGKDRTRDKVMLRSPKGGTFGKRLWKGPECNTGIRDRGLRQQQQGRNEVKDLGSGLPRYVKKPDLKKVQVKSTEILT